VSFNTPGYGRQRVALDERQEEIAAGEAHQAHKELVREAERARGGTPLHRLWRRVKSTLSTDDCPPPAA
jgi:hypothetical protein